MVPIWFIMLTSLGSGLCQSTTDYANRTASLRDRLLHGYDKNVAPTAPLVLKYGISPVKIVDMNPKRGLITVDLWLKEQWVDERLTWNPSENGNVSTLFFTENDVYVPESELYNGAVLATTMDTTNIVVYPNGVSVFFPAVRAEVYCNLAEPPFQNQICPITFGPWAHDVNQTNLTTFNPVVDHSFVYNTGLSSIGLSTANISYSQYECCPGLAFATMTLHLNLSCRMGESTSNQSAGAQALRQEPTGADRKESTYSSLPVIVTPFYVLLVFLLPVKSTGRIFLGMMIVVALLLFWTSGTMSPNQERFLVMSICMTVAATCTSLIPCLLSSLSESADGDDGSQIKKIVGKTRLGTMVDLIMLASVAVVLGISAAGVYA